VRVLSAGGVRDVLLALPWSAPARAAAAAVAVQRRATHAAAVAQQQLLGGMEDAFDFGFSSSLRDATSPPYAVCYDELLDGVVFEVEAFKPAACAHDVLWPCLPVGDARLRALPAPGPALDWDALRARARADSVQAQLGR
jgi:hypothetical protein